MKSSKNHSEDLPIERDLPTSDQDIAVLRQLRESQTLTFAEGLELLSRLDIFPAQFSDRLATEEWEPFRL